jgi:glutathione synthase/RimK-type ligase-like ATP-grasp enzyme
VLVAFVTYHRLPALAEDDRLAIPLLGESAIRVESAVWDSPLVDWSRYDAIVLRSTWDYHHKPEEFERWLAAVEHLGVPIWNPPDLLRWNMDKRYLTDLEARGIPIISTIYVERGAEVTLESVFRETGWASIVVKPVVSNNAFGTWRARIGEAFSRGGEFARLVAERDVMVQPYVHEIERDGEWSFVFIGGAYSHAVRKWPAPGDFRVQETHGGTAEAAQPRHVLVDQAAGILAHVPDRWLYARVDACEVEGTLYLMELELVEPTLFLDFDAGAPRRFADAIRRVAGDRRRATPPGRSSLE